MTGPRIREPDEGAYTSELLRPGWPKKKECLVCGRLRTAGWAGDRLCAKCGALVAALDAVSAAL